MAQNQIYTRRSQICIKPDATVDTYVTPTNDGVDMFLAEIPDEPMTIEAQQGDTRYTREDFLQMDDPPPGAIAATINFSVPIRGGGFATDVIFPDYDKALQGCGLRRLYDAASPNITTITYYPYSVFDGAATSTTFNPAQSYSVSVIEDGAVKWAIAGSFGNCTFSCPVGEPARINFAFTGAWQAPAADGLEAPTYDLFKPPAFQGSAGLTIAGATPLGVENFELDLGNQIAMRRDVNSTYGVAGARITGRVSTGSIDPELEADLNPNPWALWTAGTTGAITTGVIGATQGNRYTITVARASRRMPGMTTKDGIRKYSLPFKVAASETDVEATNLDFSLIYT